MTKPEVPQEFHKIEEPRSKLSTFLSHPAVATINLIAAIIGLVGLPLSFYFYYAAKEYPQLSYYVSPTKAVVVKAGQASKLTTSYDGKVIDTDITAVQVAVWNNGSKSIRREDILKPVVLNVDNNTPILEASIRKTSREVTQLALNTDELQKGRVTVSWNILENNDGGVIQLIYAGEPNLTIDAEGVIAGQQQLHKVVYAGEVTQSNFYAGILALSVGLIVVISVVNTRLRRSVSRTRVEALRKELEGLDAERVGNVATTKRGVKELLDVRHRIEREIFKLEHYDFFDTWLGRGIGWVFDKIDPLAPFIFASFILFFIIIGVYFIVMAKSSGPPFGF